MGFTSVIREGYQDWLNQEFLEIRLCTTRDIISANVNKANASLHALLYCNVTNFELYELNLINYKMT